MTPDELANIKRDIASFADDEYGVVDDGRGGFLFERNGQEISMRVYREDDDSPLMVMVGQEKLSYKAFLAKRLANLDLLANRMLQYDTDVEFFVDPDVIKYTIEKKESGQALQILEDEAGSPAMVGTKISFVTADAGHGKSVVLRHLQRVIAEKYLRGEVKYLFWHIDLHGRELVRLNEAIMFEVNKLRFSGLFYSTILTLMKRRLIVLGIDGFDELAAETGGETALNSLSNLMSLMEGRGTIIAASRRAFFNSQDYLRRTGLLKKSFGAGCEFNEIRIQNWKSSQCKEFLALNAFEESDYDIMASKLGAEHPLLERPYLFTKLVTMAYDSNVSPSSFLKDSPLDSINAIIDAFVKREVQKWTAAFDSETGAPYLSYEQHVRLLSEIAMEMWQSQSDVISTDNIQLLLTLLIDEWQMDERIKPKVLRLVESHALMVNVDGRDKYRRFDHEEFKNFFIAKGLGSRLRNQDVKWLRGFLSMGQLPDAVSQYLVNDIGRQDSLSYVIILIKIAQEEWKPSYVHSNIGTLIPYLLDQVEIVAPISIENKIVFSSLVFENKSIQNVCFKGCSFINISLQETQLKDVSFKQCVFSDLKVYKQSSRIENVLIDEDTTINMVSIINEQGESEVEYSPVIIKRLLKQLGFVFDEQKSVPVKKDYSPANDDYYNSVKRLLNKYAQTGCLYESTVETIRYNNTSNPSLMINDIIPLLIKYNIIQEVKTKHTSQANVKAWTLDKYEIPQVYLAEEDERAPLFAFWEEVRKHA